MAAPLRRVAELNNRGAAMLVANQDKDAFKTLQTALTIMEQEMLAAPDKSESSASSSTSSGTFSRRSSAASISSTAPSAADEAATTTFEDDNDDSSAAARFVIDTKCSTEIPELKDDRYFIFNQALLVEIKETVRAAEAAPSSNDAAAAAANNMEENNDPPQQHSQALVCFYTSVVIYNLALAYHKRGMAATVASSTAITNPSTPAAAAVPVDTAAVSTTRPNATTAIPRASPPSTYNYSKEHARIALSQSLRLYEHCLKVVRSIANYSEDCKMLLYAVSCNLAHLYCRKGDRSRAQELLDGLEEANRFSYQNLC